MVQYVLGFQEQRLWQNKCYPSTFSAVPGVGKRKQQSGELSLVSAKALAMNTPLRRWRIFSSDLSP